MKWRSGGFAAAVLFWNVIAFAQPPPAYWRPGERPFSSNKPYNFICSQVFILNDGFQNLMAGQFEKSYENEIPRPKTTGGPPVPGMAGFKPPPIPTPPGVIPLQSTTPSPEEIGEPSGTFHDEDNGEAPEPSRLEYTPEDLDEEHEEHIVTSQWRFTWNFTPKKMPLRPVGRLYFYSAGKEYFVNADSITVSPFEVDVLKFRAARYQRINNAPLISPEMEKLLEANHHFQIFDVILPENDPPFRKFALESFFAKLWGRDVVDEIISTRKNASLTEVYPEDHLDLYSYLRGQYENERLGPNIWSLSKLRYVNRDFSQQDLFTNGLLIFSTEWYAVALSRDVNRMMVCLPENYLRDGTLDPVTVNKALSEFSSHVNKMEFLKCEGVLIGETPTSSEGYAGEDLPGH